MLALQIPLPPRRTIALMVVLAVTMILELAVLDVPDRLVIGNWVTFLIFATGGDHVFLGERERQHAQLQRAREEIEGLATCVSGKEFPTSSSIWETLVTFTSSAATGRSSPTLLSVKCLLVL